MVALTLAETVASMFGVGVAFGVGAAAWPSGSTVAIGPGEGDCWQAKSSNTGTANNKTAIGRRIE